MPIYKRNLISSFFKAVYLAVVLTKVRVKASEEPDDTPLSEAVAPILFEPDPQPQVPNEITTDTKDRESSSDCSDKLDALTDELNRYKNLYGREKNNNDFLTDKMARQSSRHNDMILALSWQYDQLERKAQSYYNSFQTQKHRATGVIKKEAPVGAAKGNIIPFLFQRTKARQQMAKEAQAKADKLAAEAIAIGSNADGRGSGTANTLDDAPVARSIAEPPSFKQSASYLAKKAGKQGGLTLKSAMSSLTGGGKQTGRVPTSFNWGKGGKNRRKLLLTKVNNVKSKGINKSNADSLFARVDFRNDFKRAQRFGGIKR